MVPLSLPGTVHTVFLLLVSFLLGQSICRANHTYEPAFQSDQLLPCYAWTPDGGKATAIVVALHGATLHGRSYAPLARRLSRWGYLTVAPDLRGFGRCYYELAGEREKICYTCSQRDVAKIIEGLRRAHPGTPIICMGESLGAIMALRLAASRPELVDGLILSSPCISAQYFVTPRMLWQIVNLPLHPLRQVDLSSYIKTRISEHDNIVYERLIDPLARNRLNVKELLQTRAYNNSGIGHAHLVRPEVPVLIIQGQKDRLFKHQGVRELLAKLPAADEEAVLLPERGHIHLMTEHLKEDVMAALKAWLQEKTSILSARTIAAPTAVERKAQVVR